MSIYTNIKKFISAEAIGGLLLFICAILGIIISNTDLYDLYVKIINLQIDIGVGDYLISKPLIKWVNDGLMSIFFLMLGLEIKYHVTEGEFQTFDKILLSMSAAIGGVVFPAAIYLLFNYDNPETIRGWAIPVAFDSAFVLAILAFLPNRISIQAKIFLIGLALVDDVFAISILAIFYTDSIKIVPFLIAIICSLLLILLNKMNIKKLSAYLVVGLFLLISTIESGIHGTIAGIILALTIPTRVGNVTLVKDLESVIHPIVIFFILPVFAFLNSEVPFSQISLSNLHIDMSLGIFAGLSLGKPIGILFFSYILIKMKVTTLPKNTDWQSFIAISILNGIGFTLSLFIGTLSFNDQDLINQMRLAIIVASFTSAIIGTALLINHKIQEDNNIAEEKKS